MSKGGGWRLLPPIRTLPCQLVYPQLQEGERQKRGDFFILLSELNNMSRIIFTVYSEEKKLTAFLFCFPTSTEGG